MRNPPMSNNIPSHSLRSGVDVGLLIARRGAVVSCMDSLIEILRKRQILRMCQIPLDCARQPLAQPDSSIEPCQFPQPRCVGTPAGNRASATATLLDG